MQTINHRYGIESMALVIDGADHPIPRVSYNYFTAQPGTHPVPFSDVTVRISATSGESLLQSLGPPTGSEAVIADTPQFAHCGPAIFRDGFESFDP